MFREGKSESVQQPRRISGERAADRGAVSAQGGAGGATEAANSPADTARGEGCSHRQPG